MAKHPRLMKRGNVYWFRAKVPANLVEAYAPKREITFSLKTKDYREAITRLHIESLRVDQEFAATAAKASASPRLTLSDTEIQRLAAIHYHALLAENDDFRTHGTGETELMQAVAASAPPGTRVHWTPEEITSDDGLSEREYRKALETTEIALGGTRHDLARGKTGNIAFEVDDLLERQGIALDKASPEYRKLSIAILEATVSGFEAIEKRHHGAVIETPAPPAPIELTEAGLLTGSPRLSDALTEWKNRHRGPVKTADTFETAVDRFVSLLGDKPLRSISKADIRAYRDAMMKFPAVLTKAQRAMPVPALIASLEDKPDVKRLAAKTVNEKYLAAVSAILTLAMNEGGHIEANPCNGIRAKEDEAALTGRMLYSDSDVATIMSFPIFTAGDRPTGGAGEAARWIPLLGMFTGARMEELARLTVGDIGEEEGVAFLYIRPGEDGRRVKNRSSIRKVPIHSRLKALGFMDFVQKLGRAPNTRLFPLMRSESEQASSNWSKWWSRYARTHGINDSRKVFHSFRHTIKRKLRDARVEKTIRDAISGHSSQDVAENYGLDQDGVGVSLVVLAEAIEKISYPCFEEPEAGTCEPPRDCRRLQLPNRMEP